LEENVGLFEQNEHKEHPKKISRVEDEDDDVL
jgi:hypothetical protein